VATGGTSFESDVATATYQCTDTSSGKVQRQTWSLRTVSDAEFEVLCEACGLVVKHKYEKFSHVLENMPAKAGESARVYFIQQAV
jgi:hypothetical protein